MLQCSIRPCVSLALACGVGAVFFEEDGMNAMKDQMQKSMDTLFQSMSDVNTMARDAADAVLQSVSIVTKGCGDVMSSLSSLTQKNIDQTAKTCQSMLATTSMSDLVNAQSTSLKTSFDEMVSDISSLSQMSGRVLQQAAEPVAKHVNDSISKISKIRAA